MLGRQDAGRISVSDRRHTVVLWITQAARKTMYVYLYVWQKNKGPASLQALVLNGAGTRSRTRDLLITSQLLYQLSYTGVLGRRL